MVDGDRAVATGETRYDDGQTFSNLFVLEFDGDGRCSRVHRVVHGAPGLAPGGHSVSWASAA